MLFTCYQHQIAHKIRVAPLERDAGDEPVYKDNHTFTSPDVSFQAESLVLVSYIYACG